ncbi:MULTISPECIES: hypothetical protein [Shouchella]|uniref:Uncharacterized protein n=2 Tax=Shouchella TaxID=2893057 RepID=A0ABY7W6K2_9BACI|nr:MULTISPECIES: hypothetical protein [Shouchella]MED4127927.1 hypothetical protein [Shouchella miscanthi]WDF03073.1 hypothetical protein PQ477_16485 [Shouchella hunanensis]GAF24039.1 hypothetical protein JCM19047_3900 [Bacillus sp. JCM 19047]
MNTNNHVSNIFYAIGTKPVFTVDIHLRLRSTLHSQHLSKIGLWYDGKTTWVGEEGWIVNAAFSSTNTVIVSQAYHKGLNIKLTIRDESLQEELGVKRMISMKNEGHSDSSVKLLAQQITYTQEGLSFYSPAEKALIHYSDEKYSLFSIQMPKAQSIQYGVGLVNQIWNEPLGKLFFAPFSATKTESLMVCTCLLRANETINASLVQMSSENMVHLKRSNYLAQQSV